MRRFPILIAGAAVLFSVQPAFACRQLIPSAKFEHSDIVIDGTAICLETPGKCRLRVDHVRKGDANLKGTTLEIVVEDAPPIPKEEGVIFFGNCPQTFQPWKEEIPGRFYLTAIGGGRLFAAHPADVAEGELLQ